MKNYKLLPLSLAVAAVLSSAPSFANDPMPNPEVLDQDQQPLVLTPDMKIPAGIVFSGYARYGAAYQNGDVKLVETNGRLNGNSTGRLGNEGNGGEFQFGKGFVSDSGAIWDVVVMFNHWGDEVGVPKAYAGGTNIFESQPELYVWAGRDFHQRISTNLNDYFWMTHDGQGGGFYNLNLGGIKFDASVVSATGASPSDHPDGNYALTTKIHGIQFSDTTNLSIYANYGFDDNSDPTAKKLNAFQVAGELKFGDDRLVVRYADNAKDSVFWKTENQSALLVSFDGSKALGDNAAIEYLAAYQAYEDGAYKQYDRTNYNVLVRPMYFWDETNSTWLEAGYDVVDFDNIDATNSSWKVTLSQNISFGKGAGARPMLRFYATLGDADNETVIDKDGLFKAASNPDTVTIGAMWEAWW
ncbi:carbohydrate porin [Vibrio anguillarum]|uniref:carbohydrate porin n=1 Tax=Vibrio anguillarum TaxID=55601 RepID=UPI0002D9DAD2|nr:carbohydrate porin [Vibrio anguillarum]OEE46780.1 lactam utilization protein LamB [Vibrio anguillarum]